MRAKLISLISKVKSILSNGTDHGLTDCYTELTQVLAKKFDPTQARDSLGKWTSYGGIGAGAYYDKDQELWLDGESGKPMPTDDQERINAIKEIHKGMVGVRLNPDPKGGLLAVAYPWITKQNKVGTLKWIYSHEHKVKAYKAKFNKLRIFDGLKPKLQAQSYKDAMNGSPAAQVTFLMDQTAIRVGSGRGATKRKTFGATDLLARHVSVRGKVVKLDFMGKGGARWNKSYTSAKLASVIRVALIDKAGRDKKAGERLFKTTSDTVNAYMDKVVGKEHAKDVHAHVYRHWWATNAVVNTLKRRKAPKTRAEALALKQLACEIAGEVLNDSPDMVYSTYINPVVWRDWGDGIKPVQPIYSKGANGMVKVDSLTNFFDSFIFPDFGDDEDTRDITQLLLDPDAFGFVNTHPNAYADLKCVGGKGVWRTVRGRRVFIEEGQTVEEAIAAYEAGKDKPKPKKDEDKLPAPKGKGKGTKADPFLPDSLDDACTAIQDGMHVELKNYKGVSTLVDKIAGIVRESVKKGDKAPEFNLCKVTVKHTNVFCVTNKGIPRIGMPQLSGKPLKGSKADKLPKNKKGEVDLGELYIQHLNDSSVKVTRGAYPAANLKATQTELQGSKVAGIYGAMIAGTLPNGSIFVSRDDYVIDGHHRWAAKITQDADDGKSGDVDIDIKRVDMSIDEVLKHSLAFCKEWGIPQAVWAKKLACWGASCGIKIFDPTQERDSRGRWTALGSYIPKALYAKVRRRGPDKGGEVKLSKQELGRILKDGIYGFVSGGRNPNSSADKKLSDDQIDERYAKLKKDLIHKGFKYTNTEGHYGGKEDSFLVMCHEAGRKELMEMGHDLHQDSVIYAQHGKYEMIFTTGDNEGKYHYGEGLIDAEDFDDFYSEVETTDKGAYKFSLDFNFDELRTKLAKWFDQKLFNANQPRDERGRWASVDRAYLAAVKSGDTQAQQRMVNTYAKKAGYGVVLYQGGEKDLGDVYKLGERNPNIDRSEGEANNFGFFLTEDEGLAKVYAGADGEVRRLRVMGKLVDLRSVQPYRQAEALKALEDQGVKIPEGIEATRKQVWQLFRKHDTALRKAISDAGYTGVGFMESYSLLGDYETYAVFEPNQIKSAEPITYDSEGKVIPLSKRFDTNSDSIYKRFNPNQRRDSRGRFTDELDYDQKYDHKKRKDLQAKVRGELQLMLRKWEHKPPFPDAKITSEQYKNPNGEGYTPEREALHTLIKEYFTVGTTSVREPESYLMGGGSGAGKSTLRYSGKMQSVPNNMVDVNCDDIKGLLPEFMDSVEKKDPTLATFVHGESVYLARELTRESVSQDKNILLDATGNTGLSNIRKTIERVGNGGTRPVYANYVSCSTELALERNLARFDRTGRMIPPTYVANVHSHVSQLLPIVAAEGLFDTLNVWDTDNQTGDSVVILTSKGSDEFKVHDSVLWKKFLAKALEQPSVVGKSVTKLPYNVEQAMIDYSLGMESKVQELDPQIKLEIDEIKARGGIVDIPHDWNA